MDARKKKLQQRLDDARRELLALATGLSESEFAQDTANAGWAVGDVVAHLAAAERGHQWVIDRLLAGESIEQPGFDLDAFNEGEVAARRGKGLAELLQELAATRSRTLSLLQAVGPDDWQRGGRHPAGFDITVEGAFRIIAIHERRHLKEIKTALAG